MSTNNQTIEQLEEESRKLDRKIKSMKISSTLAGKLAIFLHDNLCSSSHEDRCGWDRSVDRETGHDWTEYAHEKYLEKAKDIISSFKLEEES